MNNLFLKDLEEHELETVLIWRNSEKIRQMMFSDQVISFSEHEAWFRRIKQDQSSIVKVFYQEESPLGLVQFNRFDFQSKSCHWGFYIGSPQAPKGVGSCMGLLALSYIFEEYGIRKLCAQIFSFNENSIRYHKKFGFKEEGCLSKHVFKNNEYVDLLLMALFKEDWLENKDEIGEKIRSKRYE